jgi:hypothetical protein
LCLLLDNGEKYRGAEQGTDDNIIRRMRIAFWITKATNTESEYKILLAFTTATTVEASRLNIRLYVMLILVLWPLSTPVER